MEDFLVSFWGNLGLFSRALSVDFREWFFVAINNSPFGGDICWIYLDVPPSPGFVRMDHSKVMGSRSVG